MRILRWLPAFALVFAVLSFVVAHEPRLPAIPGYHWKRNFTGADLYDGEGKRAASFVWTWGGETAQVCYFADTSPCQDRETDSEALAWLVVHMADRAIFLATGWSCAPARLAR